MAKTKQKTPRVTLKTDGFPKATSKKTTKKSAIIPKVIPSPVKAYTSNLGRSRPSNMRWEQPEWDLSETGRIVDTEAYVRRALRNKKNLFLKEGYEFVGPKPERVQYIKKRMRQIEEASGTPFKVLLGQTVASLVRCSNAFWAKGRKVEASGGSVRTNAAGKKLNPVAGYFLLPAETVRFKRDEYGKVTQYQQEVFGKKAKTFKPEDVIHFYFDKREGYAVGTPVLTAVKDDIRALRRIEENVELLIYQHLFPLFHYQVGTEQNPAAVYSDGTTEVDEVRAKSAMIPADGCFVTPERHKVTALSAKGSPLAVDKVIEHFKQRIFTGLGNSSVDMGEGGTANRSTAQTMSRNLVDDTKADQKEFASQFEAHVIKELLLESTFSNATLLEEDNLVELKFKEIDFESRQAKENHFVDMFMKNAITHEEMRIELGYEPFDGEGWPTSKNKSTMFVKGDGDWARTAYGLIERDKVILQSLDEPGTPASQAEAKSRTTQNKTKSLGGNSVSNKNQPTNQHGTRSSAKVNKDAFGERNSILSLAPIYNRQPALETMFDKLRSDVLIEIRIKGLKLKEVQFLTDSAFANARDRLVPMAQRAYRSGLRDAGADIWKVKVDKADAKIQGHIERFVVKLKNQLLSAIKRNTMRDFAFRSEDAIITGLIFDSLKHRTAMIDNSEIMRAYNYGKASGYRVEGFSEMKSLRHGSESCNVCDNHALSYKESDVIIYEGLPPLHPHCTCTMERVDEKG